MSMDVHVIDDVCMVFGKAKNPEVGEMGRYCCNGICPKCGKELV
jgi:hypothetical protein